MQRREKSTDRGSAAAKAITKRTRNTNRRNISESEKHLLSIQKTWARKIKQKKKKPPPIPARPLIQRHSSLIHAQNAAQVRKRISQFAKKADRRFHKKKAVLLRRSTRNTKVRLRVTKPNEESAGVGREGSKLFRQLVGEVRDDNALLRKAKSKRLVSKSVFKKGNVTGYRRKGQKKTGKLNPDLMKRFSKANLETSKRKSAKMLTKRRSKPQETNSGVGFFSTMRDRASHTKIGRWVKSKTSAANAKKRTEFVGDRKSSSRIANDLRLSKKFRDRQSKLGVTVASTVSSTLKYEQTPRGIVSNQRKSRPVSLSGIETASLQFDVLHQALFRQLSRVVLFFDRKIEIRTADGEVRHHAKYRDCDMKMKSADRACLVAPIFPKGYDIITSRAAHMCYEFEKRKRAILWPRPRVRVSATWKRKKRPSKSSKILMMTGLTERERLDNLLRRVIYDHHSDEGRTRLHFLAHIESDITKEMLAEKLSVFMCQMENFILKTRSREIRQLLDDESIASLATTEGVGGAKDGTNDADDNSAENFNASVRLWVRLRVEEAMYLPLKPKFEAFNAPSPSSSSQRSLTDERAGEDERIDDVNRDEADEVITDDVNLDSFKTFSPQHWGIEHASKSMWSAPIAHLFSAAHSQLPSETLNYVLQSAKSVFDTFRSESTSDTSELGADDYLPVHIYCLAQAGSAFKRPFERVHEMLNLCNPDVLRSEAGYYLTAMESALEYLKNYGLSPVEHDNDSSSKLDGGATVGGTGDAVDDDNGAGDVPPTYVADSDEEREQDGDASVTTTTTTISAPRPLLTPSRRKHATSDIDNDALERLVARFKPPPAPTNVLGVPKVGGGDS